MDCGLLAYDTVLFYKVSNFLAKLAVVKVEVVCLCEVLLTFYTHLHDVLIQKVLILIFTTTKASDLIFHNI
jgi:hypothetical protein